MAKDPISGTRIEDVPQIYLINNLLNDQGLAFPDTPIDLAPLPLTADLEQLMALTQQLMHIAQNQPNTNKPNILASHINDALKMLHAYTLFEMSQSQENNRVYVYVTPIVKGLIRIDQPDSLLKECASVLRFSHQVAGQYF